MIDTRAFRLIDSNQDDEVGLCEATQNVDNFTIIIDVVTIGDAFSPFKR